MSGEPIARGCLEAYVENDAMTIEIRMSKGVEAFDAGNPALIVAFPIDEVMRSVIPPADNSPKAIAARVVRAFNNQKAMAGGKVKDGERALWVVLPDETGFAVQFR